MKAPFAFIADEDASLTKAYGVKTPLVDFALRYTFLVGPDRKILKVDSGKDAVDPTTTIVACSIPARK